jgi:hypothetical protein
MSRNSFYVYTRIFFLAGTLLLAISCNNFPFLPTPTPAPRSEWVTALLESPSCPRPCWEGITPGITTYQDAFHLLSKHPSVVDLRAIPGFMSDKLMELSWVFPDAGSGSGWLRADDKGEFIKILKINIYSEQMITLEEAINAFGNPGLVGLYPDRSNFFVVDLIYPETGTILILFLRGENDQVEITPRGKILTIAFVPPGSENYAKILREYYYPDILGQLAVWNGYGEYQLSNR